MKEILTIGISFFYFATILSAQEWQYPGESGGGYSYDTNRVYTDSRGFTAFSGLSLNAVNYSGMESNSVNTVHANRYPIMNSELGLTSGAPSVLTLEKTSITNSDFTNLKISGTSNYDLFAFYISADSNLANVDFSGSHFNVSSDANRTSSFISKGVLKDVNFSGSTFVGFGIAEGNVALSGRIENVNLTNSTIKGCFDTFGGMVLNEATISSAININCDSVRNLNLSGSTLNSWSGINISSNTEVDTLIAHDVKFLNVNVDMGSFAVTQTASQTKTLNSMDFRGSTVTSSTSTEAKTLTIGDVYLRNVTNSMMGDGVIYSYNDGDSVSNKGLVLGEGETFTITAHEVSAKLTVDSTLAGGTINIEDGGLFELTDGVTLTLTDQVNILFDANALVDSVNDLVLLGEDATIVMAGYESNEAAQAAFISLFQDSEGKGVDWSPDSVANFVVAGPAIPEPATYAAIFGALALAFAAYRRRK